LPLGGILGKSQQGQGQAHPPYTLKQNCGGVLLAMLPQQCAASNLVTSQQPGVA